MCTATLAVVVSAQGIAGPAAYASGGATSVAYITSPSNGRLIFEAGNGEANNLTISPGAAGQVVLDDVYPITPGAGCSRVTPADLTKVQCATGSLEAVIYDGDGNDYTYLTGLHQDFVEGVRLFGGAGNDVIIVNCPTCDMEELSSYGDAGDDVLIQTPQVTPDYQMIFGGDGNDTLTFTGSQGDAGIMEGGAGGDTFSGPGAILYADHSTAVSVTFDGVANDGSPGEGDNVKPGVAAVYGTPGSDMLNASSNNRGTVLSGDDGSDYIVGSPYNDYLEAAAGSILQAGAGYDRCGLLSGDDINDYYITDCEDIIT